MNLRAHHLICLHFYSGQGYSPDFVAYLENLLKRAEAGEEIRLVAGADDLCLRCPHLKGGRCTYKEGSEQQIQAMDAGALRLLSLAPGGRVSWGQVEALLPRVMAEWARRHCRGCDWRWACAQDEFWRQLSGLEPVALPVGDTLDLHTFSPKEVEPLLTDYIEECLRCGLREVRIIHGKGKGVLRARVREVLARHPRVASLSDAPAGAGGWGAVLVGLKGEF